MMQCLPPVAEEPRRCVEHRLESVQETDQETTNDATEIGITRKSPVCAKLRVRPAQ